MNEHAKIIDWYIAQLQEIGYPEDEAIEFGHILYTGAEYFAEIFGITPDIYLERRLAGYFGMTQAQFLKRFDVFFKYETLEPEESQDREYLRKDFVRKPDNTTTKVIFLESHKAPKGPASEVMEWVMELLQEQDGKMEIKSTKQRVEFSRAGVKSCVAKMSRNTRKGSSEHREVFGALRDMIANAEYWYSKQADEVHATKGGLDVYISALNLNGILYAVTIKLNIPPEETGKQPDEKLKDYYYKDHSLAEIEIAPALYEGLYTKKGGANQHAAKADTEAISEVSLGILRGRVKPSLIENDTLYDIGKFDETKGGMRALLDGRRMIALFENHDVSTILHEMAHFWLEELRDAQSFSTCPDWSRELWADLEDAYGFDRETVSKRQ